MLGKNGNYDVNSCNNIAGEEIAECYVRDEDAAVRVPRHKLCGVRRIFLMPGEEQEVTFLIEEESFEVVMEDGTHVFEPGSFTCFVGGCQPDAYSEKLAGCGCVSVRIEMLDNQNRRGSRTGL